MTPTDTYMHHETISTMVQVRRQTSIWTNGDLSSIDDKSPSVQILIWRLTRSNVQWKFSLSKRKNVKRKCNWRCCPLNVVHLIWAFMPIIPQCRHHAIVSSAGRLQLERNTNVMLKAVTGSNWIMDSYLVLLFFFKYHYFLNYCGVNDIYNGFHYDNSLLSENRQWSVSLLWLQWRDRRFFFYLVSQGMAKLAS